MASPGTFSIIIDARGLGALCQTEPQHQWTQQQPGHAARVRLLFSAAVWGFLPCQSHPWLPEPWQRTDCTSREITLEQCSHPPHKHWSLLAHPGAHGRSLCVLKRSGSPAQLSVSPRCLTKNGAKDGKEGPGLQPIPTPTTPSLQHCSPHPAQETSVDQVATSCWLVTQLLFG